MDELPKPVNKNSGAGSSRRKGFLLAMSIFSLQATAILRSARRMVNFLVPLIAHMKANKVGLIAHTNSLAGFLGLPMQGPYSAAKAACRFLMDACRIELKPFGIKLVSAYPGFVASERVAEDGIPAPFEISEQAAAGHIIKAMTKERADYLFPLVTGCLIQLALILPKSITGFLLSKSVPKDY
jgi:short-subunit dehydrogenase